MKPQKQYSNRDEILADTKNQVDEMSNKIESLLLERSFDPKKSISNPEYMGLYSQVYRCAEFQQKNDNQKIQLQYNKVGQQQNQHYNEQQLSICFEEKLKKFLDKLNKLLSEENSELSYIQKTIELWENYHIYIHWLNKIFYYLNQFYYKQQKTNGSKQGYKLLFKIFFLPINEKLQRICIEQISRERNDEKIPTENVSKIIQFFYKMSFDQDADIQLTKIENELTKQNFFSYQGVFDEKVQFYVLHFEKFLINNIRSFYQDKQQNQWLKLTTPEYVTNTLKALFEEEKRSEVYYNYSKNKVIKELEKILIEQPSAGLVNNEAFGAINMLEKDQKEDLKNLYIMLKRVPNTIKFLSTKYEKFLIKQGESITKDPNLVKDPIKFIQKIIEIKDQSDDMINNIFNKDMDLIKARDNSFSIVLNHFDKTPLNLAISTDFEMKRGIKGLSQEEIDKRFQQIINLLKYINSRDAFLQHFSVFLKRRLLNNDSLDNNAEELMVQKLKTEIGGNLCSKIDKMRSDMKESLNIMEQFKKYSSEKKIVLGTNLDFSLKILTFNIWPDFDKNESNAQLPKELDAPITVFRQFFNDKFQARQLTFALTEGEAEVQASFKGKKYMFLGRNYQIIVLMLFNQSKKQTVQKLKELSKLSMIDLEFVLEGLCHKDIGLLVRSKQQNKPDQFDEDEEISLNMDFSNKQMKIRIIPKKSGPKAKDSENQTRQQQDLQREREFVLDANIVRVMKARKTLKYLELESEVVRIVNMFRPQPVEIKKRVELLIERDYLMRDEYDQTLLIYVP